MLKCHPSKTYKPVTLLFLQMHSTLIALSVCDRFLQRADQIENLQGKRSSFTNKILLSNAIYEHFIVFSLKPARIEMLPTLLR